MKQTGRRVGYLDVNLMQSQPTAKNRRPMKLRDPVSRRASGNPNSIPGRCSKAGAGLLLLWLIVAGSQLLLNRNAAVRDVSPSLQVSAASLRGRDYFQTGQWRADARSLAAAFRYLLEYDEGGDLYPNSQPARTAIGASDSQEGLSKKLEGFPADHRLQPRG